MMYLASFYFTIYFVNKKNTLHSFCVCAANSSLKEFICLSEVRFWNFPGAWFSAISNLATNLLISALMKSIFCTALPYYASLWCFSYSRSSTFVPSWFIKLSLSLMSAPALSTCCNKSIIMPMLCSFSELTFSSAFLSFSMVWLLSSKLVWKPYFMQYPYISWPCFFGINLYSSCTYQPSCYFHLAYP